MKNPICISKSSHCDLNLIGNYGNYSFYFHFNPCPLGTDNGLVVGTDKIIISLKINLYSTIFQLPYFSMLPLFFHYFLVLRVDAEKILGCNF